MFPCPATNPTPRAKLNVKHLPNGSLAVRIGTAIQHDVSTILEVIVLAACRGGYRSVGQPEKVIRL
jgi:hypothetical protein